MKKPGLKLSLKLGKTYHQEDQSHGLQCLVVCRLARVRGFLLEFPHDAIHRNCIVIVTMLAKIFDLPANISTILSSDEVFPGSLFHEIVSSCATTEIITDSW